MCLWKVAPEDRLCHCCKVWGCEDRPKGNRNRYPDPVYPAMREMPVGSWKFYPLERWSRCRTAASKLKEQFGVVYEVNRVGDEVRVKRNL